MQTQSAASTQFRGQLVTIINPHITALDRAWDELGIDNAARGAQLSAVRVAIEQAFTSIQKQVSAQITQSQQQIAALHAQLEALAGQIGDAKVVESVQAVIQATPGPACLTPTTVSPTPKSGSVATVAQKTEQLQDFIAKLQSEFQGRLTAVSANVQEIESLAATMGIRSNEVESLSRCKPISTSIDTGCVDYCRGIAAENMLHLTNIIGTLRIARSGREDKARTQIETLKALWSELGVQPQQGFEQQAFQGPPALVLSEENLDKLDQLRLDLLEARTNNAQQIAGFVEKLRLLWTRMRISESEQHMFVLEHDNVKFSSVTAFENELSRMMELKTTNMHRFIEAVRCELVELWDKCFFGEEQRHQFTHAFTNLCSEDTLQAHEQELERMEQYYADNANIFQLVSSHKQLEANLLELQSRASDTSKYNNRGGRMLQEQNATKKIQKELPVVRKQLIAALEEWESRHGKYFLVNGGRYLTTLETSLSASVVIGTLSRRPVSAMLNTSLNTSFSGGQNSSMLNTSGLNTSGLNTSGIDLNTSGLSSGSSTAAKRAGGARVAVSSSRQGNATVSAATSNVRKPVAPRAATAPRGVAPTQPVPAAKGTRGTILPPKAAANVGAVEVGAISIVEHTAPVVDFSSPRALPASFALCTSAAGMVIHESPAPRVETLRTVSANTPVRAVAAKSPMPGANRPLLQLLLTPCKTLSLDQENGTPTSVHEFSFDHDVPELSRMSVVPQFNESTI